MLPGEALARLAAAVGKDRPYVRVEGGWLWVTDGAHWLAIHLAQFPDCCVDFDRLRTALRLNPDAQVYSDDAGGLVVKDGRVRTTIRGVEPAYVPAPVTENEIRRFLLPIGCQKMIDTMLEWVGDPMETSVFMQGVLLADRYLLAMNRHEAIVRLLDPMINNPLPISGFVTVPIWACRTISGAKGMPAELIEYPRGLTINFDDGMLMHTLKLNEQPPNLIANFVAREIFEPAIDDAVPDPLREALKIFSAHKVRKMMLGNGTAYVDPKDEDVSHLDLQIEGVDVPDRQPRGWKVKNMALAMPLMQTLALDTPGKWRWAGNGYRGVFMGLQT